MDSESAVDDQVRRNSHIGNICIQWSALEYMLSQTIWALCGVDQEVGKIITANLDAKQRALMAHALAHQTNAPIVLKRAIKKTLDEMRDELIHRRNEAVHGIHFTHPDPTMIYVEMHRGKGGRNQRPLTNQGLLELGEKINVATTRMANALLKHVQSKAALVGREAEFVEMATSVLRNNSLIKDDGKKNGPQ